MHIHANPLAVQAANFHSTQMQAEIEARRADDLRRRLRKVSDALAAGSEVTPEESLLISHWTGSDAQPAPSVPTLGGDEYRPSSQNGDEYPPLR
jgi:hypothetical protein